MSFGRRLSDTPRPTVVNDGLSGKKRLQFLYLCAVLPPLVVALTIYIWTSVEKLPMTRPYRGLYYSGMACDGWAPYWVAPLVAFVGVMLFLAIRRRVDPLQGIVGILVTFLAAVIFANVTVLVVRNFGFIVICRPEMPWNGYVASLYPVVKEHMVLGTVFLIFKAPVVFIPAVVAALGEKLVHSD